MEYTNKQTVLGQIFDKEVEELQSKIEREFSDKSYKISDDYIEISIQGEYRERVKEIVGDNYLGVGWGNVEMEGSSEHGERTGLTTVKLYFDEN